MRNLKHKFIKIFLCFLFFNAVLSFNALMAKDLHYDNKNSYNVVKSPYNYYEKQKFQLKRGFEIPPEIKPSCKLISIQSENKVKYVKSNSSKAKNSKHSEKIDEMNSEYLKNQNLDQNYYRCPEFSTSGAVFIHRKK